MSPTKWKLAGLQIVTGLAVAFVRHDLEEHRLRWESFGQFLVSWIIYAVAVLVLTAFAAFAIIRFHKFFLGYEHKGTGEYEQLKFYVVMTVLVATICIFLVANYGPSDFQTY